MEHRIRGQAGTSLFDALVDTGLAVESPCGGAGTCGKCRVLCISGDVAGGEITSGSDRGMVVIHGDSWTERLACKTTFIRDGEARIFIQTEDMRIVDDSSFQVPDGEPATRILQIQLPEPELIRSGSELERIMELAGRDSILDLHSLRLIAGQLENGTPDARRITLIQQDGRHLAFASTRTPLAVAVDIGTTTVAARLFNACTGEVLASGARANVQRWAGADVIARISACSNEKSFKRLTTGIATQITSMIGELAEAAGTGAGKQDVTRIAIAGNPTMLHILAGIEPAGIARAPFVPVFTSAFDFSATESPLGNHFARECRTILLPGISAYVGADLVAGAVAGGLGIPGEGKKETTLLLDLGTNGEIMLFSEGKSYCCSAAAGPAFEGAAIEFGMPSIPGAIDHVSVRNGKVETTVIGDRKVKGLCGSGILDATASFLASRAIDETGRIDPAAEGLSLDPEWFVEYHGKPAILTDRESGTVLTQDDIRQIQLAKGAVAAGVNVLLSRAGIRAEDVDTVLLAGGFGSRLDPESALGIGLLPPETRGKIEAVGNASLAGASLVALRSGTLDTCGKIASGCLAIELSGLADFVSEFQSAMLFPWADADA